MAAIQIVKSLTIYEAEIVTVRIFEPSHLDIAEEVHVAFAPGVRQIVVFDLAATAKSLTASVATAWRSSTTATSTTTSSGRALHGSVVT
jgi:hypothetical protein